MNWHNVLLRPRNLYEELLRRKLISGGGVPAVLQTVTGISPLTLLNVASRGIESLTQFGKCEQTGTPTPSAPINIKCNNGTLMMVDDELPTGYKRVANIKFDGDFWYETGEALTGDDDVTMTLDDTSSTGQNVFGSYNGTASGVVNFSLFIYGGGSASGSYFRYGTQLIRPRFGTGERTITFGKSGTDGFLTDATATPDTFTTPANAYIGMLPNSTSPAFTGTIVGNITVGTRLKWIPCERTADGAVGYYEAVSGVFLEPSGTGTPVKGAYDYTHAHLEVVGTPEVLTICGKNLCPNKSYAVNSNSTQIGSDDADAYPFYFVGGTTYTVSYSATKKIKVYLKKNTDQSGVLQGESQTSVSFIPADSGWYRIVLNNATGYASANVTNIQIEVGSTATDYEAYTEQTASVENLFKIAANNYYADYTDEQNIISGIVTRKVGVKVLNGTEDWGYSSPVHTVKISDAVTTELRKTPLLCTHYPIIDDGRSFNNTPDKTMFFTSGKNLGIKDSTKTSEQMKAWLAAQYANGTPVVIVYPLAEATTEQVTAQHLSARDTATITAQTDNISDISLEVQYWQKAE